MSTNRTSSNMDRRSVLGGGLGATTLLAAPAFAKAPAKRPNFLFIMADDLGYADLSCYGRSDYRTPVLDKLARRGMRFTHAYANSPVCTPTRVALATGRYQYRLPIGLQEPLVTADVGLPPEHSTMASLLQAKGYHTSLIGKWHMGALPKYGPLQSGYDQFWGIRSGGVDYFRHETIGQQKDLWDGDTPVEQAGYMTDLLADRTVQTLRQRAADNRNFMISLHLTAPHWPWEGPGDAAEAERLAATGNPATIFHYDGGSLKTYAEMVTSMDAAIGRVLRVLDQLKLSDNTVVVFTSDNGGERFSNTWPFTGRKTELLEGGIRVPAIVRWPGVSKPGSESDVPIMSMDWLPTFAAAAGASTTGRPALDGVDIRKVVGGDRLSDRMLFWRYNLHGQKAVRHSRWKYLEIAGNQFLFDIIADPLERANLKDREPAVFKTLQAEFAKWNAGMLYDPSATSSGYSGKYIADHYGN